MTGFQPTGDVFGGPSQRLQNRKHRVRADLIDRTRPKFPRSFREAPAPLFAVFLVAPLPRFCLKQRVGDLSERRLVRSGSPYLPPHFDGIAPGLKDATSLISGGAGFCKPHSRVE